MPEFETPVLSKPATAADAPLVLRDESSMVKTLIRSDQPQFDLAFGRCRQVGATLVAATRPDEWLILGGDAEGVAETEAQLDLGGFTNVIPFTHGRALFEITGADASRMLEKVCGIDWSDAMTPDGAVVSASVALVTCDIIRHDADEVPSYLLVFDRSFGQYLFDALLDAGSEFSIGVG